MHLNGGAPSSSLAGRLAASPSNDQLEETRQTLLVDAEGRFGDISPALIVDHVLDASCSAVAADYPVRAAAFEAVTRRWAFATRDGLAVATRPAGGRVLGTYTTTRPLAEEPATTKRERRRANKDERRAKNARRRRAPREARPYTSTLERVSPFLGSCDCPDFLTSSLGVCKHLLVVLADVHESPKRLARALEEQARSSSVPPVVRLTWDFALPLRGGLDRVAGLSLAARSGSGSTRSALAAPRTRGVLARDAATVEAAFEGEHVRTKVLRDPVRRRDLLTALDALARGGAFEATPAAHAIVRSELARAELRARCEAARPAALATLRTLKRKLYPYQKEGVAAFLSAGRLLLADDMGLGKTTQAIAACHGLHRSGRIRRGIVIAPASLKAQWLREWQATTDVPAVVVDGTPAERARIYREHRDGFLIANYEQLLRDATQIQATEPEMVVLDEAQRIKNYATKSAIYVKSLAPEYRLVLTGTPMENRLEELASILDWVDELALAPKWRLVSWHTEWTGDAGKEGRAGARNLDTLRDRMRGCVVRRVRKEVLAQLPPRTDTRVPVPMTAQQAGEHDELSPAISRLLQIARRRPLLQVEFLRLMQLLTQQRIIANGLGQLRFEEIWPAYGRARPDAALLEGLFAPKLGELRRLVTDLVIAQGRKVVVFSQWRRMLRLAEWSVRDILEDAGLRAVFFTGAEKQAQRTRSVVDLHDDPRARVMFLSDAGGVGLNLQKAASACINLELPWNPAVLEQRIGRIYRLGQEQPIDVYNLVSEGSIEERIAGIVGTKQALFSGLFDGTSDELRFETSASFLTQVERIVDPGLLPEAPGRPSESATVADDEDESEVEADAPAPIAQPPGVDEARRDPVSALFDVVRVERTASGGVRIEAPPEATASLLALFQGMAQMLGAAAAAPKEAS